MIVLQQYILQIFGWIKLTNELLVGIVMYNSIFMISEFFSIFVFYLPNSTLRISKIASKKIFDPLSRVKSQFFEKISRKSHFWVPAHPCAIVILIESFSASFIKSFDVKTVKNFIQNLNSCPFFSDVIDEVMLMTHTSFWSPSFKLYWWRIWIWFDHLVALESSFNYFLEMALARHRVVEPKFSMWCLKSLGSN